MSRRKATAMDVPASAAEATTLLGLYVAAERQAAQVRLSAEKSIDAIAAERDVALAQILAEQKPRFSALKAWWEAGGKVLAGRNRSAELAGAKLGLRLGPPKVKLARGVTAAALVLWLAGLRSRLAGRMLRVKQELDKEAIAKAWPDDAAVRKMFGERLSVIQVDEFFIDCSIERDDPIPVHDGDQQ